MKTICVLLLTATLVVAAQAGETNNSAAVSAKPAEHKPDDVVARVGKTEIKWQEVDAASKSFLKEYALHGRAFPDAQIDRLHYDVVNQMVTRELVLEQAIGHEPADIDVQVKEQVEQTKAQAGGDEGLTKALDEMGLTLADYTKRVHEGLLIQDLLKKIVDEKASVSDDDIKKFYDDNRPKFLMPEQVRASHVLIIVPPNSTDEVKTQKLIQAEAALSLIKKGEAFADVARKFSEDPGSAQNGGDLEFFSRGQMVPQFEAAAFALKTNEVSEIITTQYGYHIIKVTDHKPPTELAFADVKPKIERYLKEQQGQKIAKNYVDDLRTKTKVEILLPEPPPLPRMPESSEEAPQ